MLHHPFGELSQLLSIDCQEFFSWPDTLQYCGLHHVGEHAHPHFSTDGFRDITEEIIGDDEFEIADPNTPENDLF